MLIIGSICTFCTFGIALIVLSYFPFNELKSLFDSFAGDGDFQSFSINHVKLLRVTGILLCFAGGLGYVFRRKALKYIPNLRITDFPMTPRKILQYMPEFKITDFLISPKDIFIFMLNIIRDIKEAVRKEDKIHLYTFLLLLILAITVRIYYVSRPWVTDEVRIFENHVNHAQGFTGLFQLLTQYDENGHHMFYTFWAYLSYKFLGGEQSIWLTRLPALVAGVLLLPAVYIVMRIFYNKHSALLSSGIVAASYQLILYSTRSRGHIILCLIFMLILALAAYIKKNNNLAGWHLLAILSAFGYYTIPIMLWPHGMVITWLILSIIFEGPHLNRCYLLKNLFVSIALTVLLTFLLYSPVLFFGTGLKSLLNQGGSESWENVINSMLLNVSNFSVFWNKYVPDFIKWFLVSGFFASLIFHNKMSAERVNIVLASAIWFFPTYLVLKVTPDPRHMLFFILLYIGLASAGLTYLVRNVETVFGNYRSVIFSILTIILSVVLIGNIILSEPWYGSNDNFEGTGKYIDIGFVSDCVGMHMLYDRRDNYNMKNDNFDKGEYSPRILTVFRSPGTNNYFMKRLQKSITIGKLVISDMDSYLSKDSRRCHSLFLVSTEDIFLLKVLLEEKGLPVSDFTSPQLIHHDKYANLYKLTKIKNCMQ